MEDSIEKSKVKSASEALQVAFQYSINNGFIEC